MKIYEEYVPYKTRTPSIKEASYLGNFIVNIQFSNGETKAIDFKGFLAHSTNPGIEKFRSEAYFKGFEVVDGNLNWYDYEMIFPLKDLYQGEI